MRMKSWLKLSHIPERNIKIEPGFINLLTEKSAIYRKNMNANKKRDVILLI